MNCPKCDSLYTEQLQGSMGTWSCGCGHIWGELPSAEHLNKHLLFAHDEDPCSRCKGEGYALVVAGCIGEVSIRCPRCQGKGVVSCVICHFCGRMGDAKYDFSTDCTQMIENAEPLELVLFERLGLHPLIIPTGKVRWV